MRTNDDQWSITTSVGRTALLVALGRALETRSDDALISDPYATIFITASGETDLAPSRIEALLEAGDDAVLTRAVDMLRHLMAARTRRIDVALAEANATGCLQVAILAAGLDARAYRLDWAPGTTVFEVDQPDVLQFKDAALGRLGARPTTDRRAVARDLRGDWLGALRETGLRTDRPTVWLCEGLLPYLTSDDQQQLLATIGTASPSGSVLVLDAPREPFDVNAFDVDSTTFGVQIDELFFDTGHFAAQAWLDRNGWATSSDSLGALLTQYGRHSDVFTASDGRSGPDAPATLGDAFDIVVAHESSLRVIIFSC